MAACVAWRADESSQDTWTAPTATKRGRVWYLWNLLAAISAGTKGPPNGPLPSARGLGGRGARREWVREAKPTPAGSGRWTMGPRAGSMRRVPTDGKKQQKKQVTKTSTGGGV